MGGFKDYYAMQEKYKFKLFTVFGVPMYVHWSLFLGMLIFFIAFLGYGVVAAIFLAILIVPLSILLHELAHLLCFKYFGYTIDYGMIHLYGGHVVLSGSETFGFITSKHDIIISFAGPLSNLLFSLFFALITAFYSEDDHDDGFYLFIYACYAFNMILFLFNMLPIYPFDGARIFYGLLHKVSNFGYQRGWCKSCDPHSGSRYNSNNTGGDINANPAGPSMIDANNDGINAILDENNNVPIDHIVGKFEDLNVLLPHTIGLITLATMPIVLLFILIFFIGVGGIIVIFLVCIWVYDVYIFWQSRKKFLDIYHTNILVPEMEARLASRGQGGQAQNDSSVAESKKDSNLRLYYFVYNYLYFKKMLTHASLLYISNGINDFNLGTPNVLFASSQCVVVTNRCKILGTEFIQLEIAEQKSQSQVEIGIKFNNFIVIYPSEIESKWPRFNSMATTDGSSINDMSNTKTTTNPSVNRVRSDENDNNGNNADAGGSGNAAQVKSNQDEAIEVQVGTTNPFAKDVNTDDNNNENKDNNDDNGVSNTNPFAKDVDSNDNNGSNNDNNNGAAPVSGTQAIKRDITQINFLESGYYVDHNNILYEWEWNPNDSVVNCKVKFPPCVDKFGTEYSSKAENENKNIQTSIMFRSDNTTKDSYYFATVQSTVQS